MKRDWEVQGNRFERGWYYVPANGGARERERGRERRREFGCEVSVWEETRRVWEWK